VERAIVAYHQDEQRDWVAELACGHQRHVRHQPPFQVRPWVLSAEGRQQRLGTYVDCGLCDQEPAPPQRHNANEEAT
jgi:tellurite methyltransferase